MRALKGATSDRLLPCFAAPTEQSLFDDGVGGTWKPESKFARFRATGVDLSREFVPLVRHNSGV